MGDNQGEAYLQIPLSKTVTVTVGKGPGKNMSSNRV